MENIVNLYKSGLSIPQVSERVGKSLSAVRYHIKKAGALRSRADGVRLAASQGRMGWQCLGKSRDFTAEHCEAISKGRAAWAKENAVGTRISTNGYVEYTMGENKFRSVHVVKMEKRLGRRIRDDEIVHHIDKDKQNNDENNLALMTRSGHTRHHRREERITKDKD